MAQQTQDEPDASSFIDKEDDNELGVGLNYANGPLNVDYVYVNSGEVATVTGGGALVAAHRTSTSTTWAVRTTSAWSR